MTDGHGPGGSAYRVESSRLEVGRTEPEKTRDCENVAKMGDETEDRTDEECGCGNEIDSLTGNEENWWNWGIVTGGSEQRSEHDVGEDPLEPVL